MIGVALLAIDYAKAVNSTRLQVYHLQVGLRVPDREGAVIGYGIEDEASVRTDARMTYTPFTKKCIHLSTYGASALIKGNADETVLQVLDVMGQTHGVGTAIVDVLAVG